jgi:4-carboxymuconolactone decarboxylase
MMRTRLLTAMGIWISAAALSGQAPAVTDIHPESLSRVPPVRYADLDTDGQRIWNLIAGANGMPRTGPAPVSMYSPKVAEPMHLLNQYLRTSVVGSRYFELSALVAAREFDQQYEWSGHEPAALKAGLDQAAIDVVKYNRDPAGLPAKESTIVRLGRALLRDHKVDRELWGKTVELFGRQGAIEITTTFGDYVLAGLLLTAVDQQLPGERRQLLPPK